MDSVSNEEAQKQQIDVAGLKCSKYFPLLPMKMCSILIRTWRNGAINILTESRQKADRVDLLSPFDMSL